MCGSRSERTATALVVLASCLRFRYAYEQEIGNVVNCLRDTGLRHATALPNSAAKSGLSNLQLDRSRIRPRLRFDQRSFRTAYRQKRQNRSFSLSEYILGSRVNTASQIQLSTPTSKMREETSLVASKRWRECGELCLQIQQPKSTPQHQLLNYTKVMPKL